ncbi:uncharacterized protein BXZ73DRAFT_99125 [Epithele typhae]|uniref:uncharacterized protein n=1 Tax=Epithele typhae TaxID=378194 RepID=UPI0020086CED|nr:uncharacterized protein BXZ73DRAFT_99125 [Epithele typhae]KAH9940127.1 hypothetical protein BXZ73DRAFT_99125 [Epithele typhae]
MPALRPYSGQVRKLVMGIDIGTSHSGVAYALLEPGEIPEIRSVTRFPGHEASPGDCKIPSILYYTPGGSVAYAGAEAVAPGVDLKADDEGLIFVEWFKLHMIPERLQSGEIKKRDLPSLPPGKSVVSVFADFLAYLFSCARQYIRETHANGKRLWESLEDDIEFELSHPNGWEGMQQSKMRQAAIMGGLVPNTVEGRGRVHFVTEGEASLHFCVQSGLTTDSMQDGQSVMIVDLGGGTVDISSYGFVSKSPLVVEEVAAPECILQGSTRINARAAIYLKALLKNSPYGEDDYIKLMLESFEMSTKRVFKDENQSSYVKFGTPFCSDPQVKIRRGQLTLTGDVMRSLFQPSLDSIISAIKKQLRDATKPPSTVFLVGGFAANPWLYSALDNRLQTLGLSLCRPDSHTAKAVSTGAVCFFLEHFVSARVMKMTYGAHVILHYDPEDSEHFTRRANSRVAHTSSALDSITTKVICYSGPDSDPAWLDIDTHLFQPVCCISADTSCVKRKAQLGVNGEVYYKQSYDVVLLCGLTELEAQIRWRENGKERRGPARIIYEDD